MDEKCLKNISIGIGDKIFNCYTDDENLTFDDISISKYRVVQTEMDFTTFRYTLSLSYEDDASFQLVFKGEMPVVFDLSYTWRVLKKNNLFKIIVDFEDGDQIKSLSAVFKKNQPIVDIVIYPWKSESLSIDPLIHPLGPLVLTYLFLWSGSFFIHGSAVNFNNKTFLFTGVSGIGKSTMARLWNECGAEVINDDRLLLKGIGDNVNVYNNPMFYQQEPKKGTLSGIFLLKQEKYNYIKKVEGVQAFTRVLANCIQQLYEPEMIKEHLALVEGIVQRVPVYEVGFLPTHDIVRDILNFYDNESRG